MHLPRIAPLTRRESKAARMLRESMRPAEQLIAKGGYSPDDRELFQAMTVAIDRALTEYVSRPFLLRWFPRPEGHLTRLRPWLEEMIPVIKGRLDGMDGAVDVPE